MKVKTSTLTGAALDWAVAKADGVFRTLGNEGYWGTAEGVAHFRKIRAADHPSGWTDTSTDWAQGGPIIEREKIELHWSPLWNCWGSTNKQNARLSFMGPTPLIAAMRCHVASSLGDEVDVPEELMV